MPLPRPNTDWPPKPYDKLAEPMSTWSAWWAGDQDALTEIYATNQQTRTSTRGLVNAVVKFFWGRPNQQGTTRLHVPAAADLARASSDLLFSERPTFTFPPPPDDEDGNPVADEWREKAQERLDAIANNDAMGSMLNESGELASFLGGVFYRLWWDEDISDHVMVSCHPADTAIPEWRYDRLAAVTFWRKLDAPDKADASNAVIRHLERHEKGKIYHGLYKGTDKKLGMPMPLDEHPDTEWAAKIVDKDGAFETGIDRLTVAYVPNARPNRKWRTEPELANLGRSDFDGIEPLFDALDEVYTSWMRDVRHGKSRLMVAEDALQNNGPGRGGTWDEEKSIYTPVPSSGMGSMASGGGNLVEQAQFNIRWQEHSQTSAEILNSILRAAGLSAAQYSDSNLTVGVPTATEVDSRNALSERTRTKKAGYYRAALGELIAAALELDAELYDTGVTFEVDPVMEFPVRSLQSPKEKTEVLAQQKSTYLTSSYTAVSEMRPNWTAAEIKEELKRIKADRLEEMKIAYGKADEGGAETPMADTEGQPDDAADDGADAETGTDDWATDDGELDALAEQLTNDAIEGEA